MTHDLLCPNGEMTWLPDTAICLYCHVIARVREDERAVDRAGKYNSGYVDGSKDAYAAALRDAVEAVVNCDDYHSAANMLLVDAYREGLQAAREAIEGLGGER